MINISQHLEVHIKDSYMPCEALAHNPKWMNVMSPYKFTSKTHSLSTEDLGKFFIDSFIHLPFNTAGTFYLIQNSSCKIRKNSQKIRKKNKWKYEYFWMLPWGWRGCVQGWYLNIETCCKMIRYSEESHPKHTNDIPCCHDVEGAVFRVHI